MDQEQEKKEYIHEFENKTPKKFFTGKIISVLAVVILFGVVTGYFLSQSASTSSVISKVGISNPTLSKGSTEGSDDLKTFKDSAEGVLKEGGVNGEGAFHLERPGGESQNVYLTSSEVDLSKYINKKIKVNGQTQKAQTAGWLMDVGRVEVL